MNILEKFNEIETFIFDVDGVLTDGTLILTEEGHLLRKMYIRDGYAIKRALSQGYGVFIISGGKSAGVVHRLKRLGVKDIYTGIEDKTEVLEELLDIYNLNAENILYLGDDLPDYEVMKRVGLPACPFDAAQEIKSISHYISPMKGGEGCVRDVIEKVLKLHGKWLES